MASLANRPLVIHEQNSIAGLANKVLAGVADRVLVAFPDALKKSLFVGNPVRGDIAALAAPRERFAGRSGALRVLVVGGSLGAQALNEIVPQALAKLPAASRPQVRHQSGAKHIDALRANYAAAASGRRAARVHRRHGRRVRRRRPGDLPRRRDAPSRNSPPQACASILVPFPFAVDDHQTTNARYLADAGAAVLCSSAT